MDKAFGDSKSFRQFTLRDFFCFVYFYDFFLKSTEYGFIFLGSDFDNFSLFFYTSSERKPLYIDDVEIELDFPRDQKDAKFLACAIAGSANFLITRDNDFTEAPKILDTIIISISDFNRLVIFF